MINGVDWLPIRPGGAAERVYTELQAGAADDVHVDDVSQILDVRENEVLLVRGVRLDGRGKRHAP